MVDLNISAPSSDTESSGEGNTEDIVQDEPMYYVLGQFLAAPNGQNVVEVLQEMVKEIRSLREEIRQSREKPSS